MISARRAEQLGPQLLRRFRATPWPTASPRSGASVRSLPIPARRRARLGSEPIDLRELVDAYSVQMLYRPDKLGPPVARLSLNGGAIAVGYRYGMFGGGLISKAFLDARRRGLRSTVITNFIGEGMGATAPFDVA